jgi:cytochrome bd ubiquinol oxidase subunit II
MEYAILRAIWWGLVAILMIGLVIMDGHDMWDGNQVWFITGGGAVFAAWPMVYATSFSMLYIAILAVLWAIFLRAPAFEYRSKITSSKWRHTWDWVLFVGSAVPPILFGVAVGNVMIGIPFHFTNDMRLVNDAANPLIGFLHLLSPFALICGLLSFCMITTHGAIYLALRTDGKLQHRAKHCVKIFATLSIILFAIGGFFIAHLNGYIATNLNPNGYSDPLAKIVYITPGAWLNNYMTHLILFSIPILGFIGIIGSIIYSKKDRFGLAFIASSISMACIILTAGVAMFPFIIPSSSNPVSSLTVWDATSSKHTLFLMLIAVIIFTPLILIYTSWVYKIMRGTIKKPDIY